MYTGLIDAFSGKIDVHVEDIHLVLDYEKLFHRVTDKHLAKLHKKRQTQHCWCFQAVGASVDFPLGVKVRLSAIAIMCQHHVKSAFESFLGYLQILLFQSSRGNSKTS